MPLRAEVTEGVSESDLDLIRGVGSRLGRMLRLETQCLVDGYCYSGLVWMSCASALNTLSFFYFAK